MRIIQFIRNLFDTLLYFAVMCVKENFRNYISRAGVVGEAKPKVAILGNGPSLKGELSELIARRDEYDFFAVNFFGLDDAFEILQPKYFVLSDPAFFRDTPQRERVMELYRHINERVTWQMNLYVQFYNPERFDYRAYLPNPNIRIVPFHSHLYRGFSSVEFWLFSRGLGSANFGTVVQNCEYIAILLNYKYLELYGVDHTLLDGLCVDSENRLHRRLSYYYDSGETQLQPLYMNHPYRPYTLSEYLAEMAELFRGHRVLANYAKHKGVRIINRTRNSMIDAYERG